MISFDEHQERLQLYSQGLNDREIAEKLYLTPSAIIRWRQLNNLPSNMKINNRRSEERKLILYNAGFTDKEMAQQLKLKVRSVQSWRVKRKLKANTR